MFLSQTEEARIPPIYGLVDKNSTLLPAHVSLVYITEEETNII